eukprot:464754-Rhodomonas_salina.1
MCRARDSFLRRNRARRKPCTVTVSDLGPETDLAALSGHVENLARTRRSSDLSFNTTGRPAQGETPLQPQAKAVYAVTARLPQLWHQERSSERIQVSYPGYPGTRQKPNFHRFCNRLYVAQ